MCCPQMWWDTVSHKGYQQITGIGYEWSGHNFLLLSLYQIPPQQCSIYEPVGDPRPFFPRLLQHTSPLTPHIGRNISPLNIYHFVDPLMLSNICQSGWMSTPTSWWDRSPPLFQYGGCEIPSLHYTGLLWTAQSPHLHPLGLWLYMWGWLDSLLWRRNKFCLVPSRV